MAQTSELELYRLWPELLDKLPRIPLTTLPTRVHRLEGVARETGFENIWIKRDDESSEIYGSNKPRKFEFYLADAKNKGAEAVIANGAIGSNHALATAIFAREMGMKAILCLYDQPLDDLVRDQMLLDMMFGAEMIYVNGMGGFLIELAKRLARNRPPFSNSPLYWIPPGGSSTLGNIGYVNAGLEFARQVRDGVCPRPELIFVTAGTCGTAAGIDLGLSLAELPIPVIGVRIVETLITNQINLKLQFETTSALLHKLCPSIPRLGYRWNQVRLIHDFYGGEYGSKTPEAENAVELMALAEKICLETTYTGKTFAAVLDQVSRNKLRDRNVLYWHTYHCVDFSEKLAGKPDYHELPPAFHKFFK